MLKNYALSRRRNTGNNKVDLTFRSHSMLLILDSTDNSISAYTPGVTFHSILKESGPVERTVLDRLSSADNAHIEKVINDCNPDIVLNCIEYGDIDRAEYDRETAYWVNGFLMKNLASVCRERDALLVSLGSSSVFSGRSGAPGREEDRHDPVNVYGDSKSLGEKLVAESGCRSLTVRLPYLYGDGIPLFNHGIGPGYGQQGLTLLDGQVIAPTRTADAAMAVAALIACRATGVYHFSAGGTVVAADFAAKALELGGRSGGWGEKVDIKQVRDGEFLAPADRPVYNVLDTKKYEDCTGLRPNRWEAALEEYIVNNKDSIHFTVKENAR